MIIKARADKPVQVFADLQRQEWGYRIAHLSILLGSIPKEYVVIGESLQSRGFAHRQASALERIRVNEVMPILRDMARHGAGRQIARLTPEAISEVACVPVPMV